MFFFQRCARQLLPSGSKPSSNPSERRKSFSFPQLFNVVNTFRILDLHKGSLAPEVDPVPEIVKVLKLIFSEAYLLSAISSATTEMFFAGLYRGV